MPVLLFLSSRYNNPSFILSIFLCVSWFDAIAGFVIEILEVMSTTVPVTSGLGFRCLKLILAFSKGLSYCLVISHLSSRVHSTVVVCITILPLVMIYFSLPDYFQSKLFRYAYVRLSSAFC
jgi:hypothetical protein